VWLNEAVQFACEDLGQKNLVLELSPRLTFEALYLTFYRENILLYTYNS